MAIRVLEDTNGGPVGDVGNVGCTDWVLSLIAAEIVDGPENVHENVTVRMEFKSTLKRGCNSPTRNALTCNRDAYSPNSPPSS